MVNWEDPGGRRTALSDEEVDMIEEKAISAYKVRDPLDGQGEPQAERIRGGRPHAAGNDARR